VHTLTNTQSDTLLPCFHVSDHSKEHGSLWTQEMWPLTQYVRTYTLKYFSSEVTRLIISSTSRKQRQNEAEFFTIYDYRTQNPLHETNDKQLISLFSSVRPLRFIQVCLSHVTRVFHPATTFEAALTKREHTCCSGYEVLYQVLTIKCWRRIIWGTTKHFASYRFPSTAQTCIDGRDVAIRTTSRSQQPANWHRFLL